MKNLFYTLFIVGFVISCGTENKPTYKVTTTVSPSEGGTITLSPSGGVYSEDEVVTLTGTPSNGWRFVRWEGEWSAESNPTTITISKNYSVVGVFEKRNYPLTINIEGFGEVEERVIQQKTTEYPFQTVVELTPVPDDGWKFVEWSDDLSGNDVPKQITVDGEKTVTAKFERKNYPLTINIVGEGTVKETVLPQKTTEYPFETVVELTARPTIIANEIWLFSGWSGDTNGADNPITIEITKEMNITATFTQYQLKEGEVHNPVTGRIWMDRNLGATSVATSSTDTEAYGDLYQWGRRADGHQKRNSSTISTLSNSDTPSHGSFILAPNAPYDWRSPQNNNLWQGVNGVNNPCPVGYRIPTVAEWEAERQSWSSNNASGAFNSPLKLPMAGNRDRGNGSLNFGVGSYGFYWSSSVSGSNAQSLNFFSRGAYVDGIYSNRAFGRSIRCLKD